MLENGKLGKLFKSEDSTDLAKTVIDLLRDESTRKNLSETGIASSEKYDWNDVASQIESVYEISAANRPNVTVGSEKD